ncbi:biotin/lipoyl-binding protein [Candidatus Woesearchaeota archaeon]|nr:biotin/lipoyl-binding protein [Candidatus Woesearchaeota archaeon]
MEDLTIKVDGKEYHVKIEETDSKLRIHCGNDVYDVNTGNKEAAIYNILKDSDHHAEGSGTIISPLPGTIFEVNVKAGMVVKEGDSLIKLIAMKMENDITAPKEGKVMEVKVSKNDNVNKGDVLLIID